MPAGYDIRTGENYSENRTVESLALISIPSPPPPMTPLNVDEPTSNDSSLHIRTPPEHYNDDVVLPLPLQKYLPPRGRPAQYFTRCLACLLVWAAIYCVIGKKALPGSNIFSLYILLVAATLGGFLAGWKTRYFHFPPLLGMLIVGFLLRNIKYINIAKSIDPGWSSALRNTALAIILLRSGLGLDTKALRRLKCTVLRLAFTPCIVEAVTVAIVSHFLLKLPWVWSFQLG